MERGVVPNDLFINLEKYRTTNERAQTENFLTELVAYLLREEPTAREEFVRLVVGEQAGRFLDGHVVIRTQCFTESPNRRLNGLFLDMVLRSGESELIVENKVGDVLTHRQLSNYLEYAHERDGRWVAVVTKVPQDAVRGLESDSRFIKETLWWEVADRWSKGKAYSNQFLVNSVLEFMEAKQMGPLEPYQMEEMAAPELWNKFSDKTGKILHRLSKKIRQPDWAKGGKFKWQGVFSGGKIGMHNFNGLLWYIPYNSAKANAGDSEFWYFVGFRFGSTEWLLPPLEVGQPECIVSIDVWRPERVSKLMLDEAERLNRGLTTPVFEVGYSKNRLCVSLFRRRQLKRFIDEGGDQAAAILDFLEQSHEKLWPVLPKIHEHYRKAP